MVWRGRNAVCCCCDPRKVSGFPLPARGCLLTDAHRNKRSSAAWHHPANRLPDSVLRLTGRQGSADSNSLLRPQDPLWERAPPAFRSFPSFRAVELARSADSVLPTPPLQVHVRRRAPTMSQAPQASPGQAPKARSGLRRWPGSADPRGHC